MFLFAKFFSFSIHTEYFVIIYYLNNGMFFPSKVHFMSKLKQPTKPERKCVGG